MADQPRRPLTDTELDAALRDLGDRIDYPTTPALAAEVRARLSALPRRRAPISWSSVRRFAVAAVILILILGAFLSIWPSGMTAIADRLGLRGVTIEFVRSTPTAAPVIVPTTATASADAIPPTIPELTSDSIGVRLRLGRLITLVEASTYALYQVRVPTLPGLGQPNAVYVDDRAPGRPVTLVYRDRAGFPPADETGASLLMIQFRGDVEAPLLGKMLGPGVQVETVRVNGASAYWIEGAPHAFFYRDPGGTIREETIRLAGNVLLWQAGPLTLRLEGALTKEQALTIAASVR